MFQIERVIGSSHLGDDGTVRLSSVVDFMQDCCCFHLDSQKELSQYFSDHNITMFLISRQINLMKPIYYGEHIFVRTWIYQMRSTYGYRNTMIYNQQNQLLVSSYAGGAFVKKNPGGSVIMPRKISGSIALDPKSAVMEYLPRKIPLPKKEQGIRLAPTPVFRHYIDQNHHINNARYIDIAQEFLPSDFCVQACRVEYKTAAKYGDELFPVCYQQDPSVRLISLQNATGGVFANVEFRGGLGSD